ncbi:phospholipase D-like domain-containing protein [bacterium]|nr:phospholipase D-like domain-containing protein [bacterium]MCI0565754.1 phospholipase D-like domain-containing protein [bacterium]
MTLTKAFVYFCVLVIFGLSAYGILKPLPKGVGVRGSTFVVPENSVTFLSDTTYMGEDGERHTDQEVFDEVFRMIARAERYILIDMFLWNSFQGALIEETRPLSSELTEALILKKEEYPDIEIAVITDPINTVYGGARAPHLNDLEAAGITIITTNLLPLRESNPAYSSFWLLFAERLGNSKEGGWLPHPFDARRDDVTLRSWLSLMNFKANHRKLIMADDGRKMPALITSANPHDASSAHGNVALKVDDFLWIDIFESEQNAAVFSDAELPPMPARESVRDTEGGHSGTRVTLLTEGEIKKTLLHEITRTEKEDTIDMAMFYLSDRNVIGELIAAAKRGVSIRIILDPNKDAFGRQKNGVPNRPVAKELLKKSGEKIEVRWCDTHGEQCHSKLVLIKNEEGHHLILGSANLTRRNIGNFNLETNVHARSAVETDAFVRAREYFETMWENKDAKKYTADYSAYADRTLFLKTAMYRFMEWSGMSSW